MKKVNEHLEKEYIFRINKSLDYIEKNISQQLTLEEVSAVANFSKFHFNRIFQAITGETAYQLILRLRLEKAAIIITQRPNENISEIALKCGFTDASVFARNFKSYFKVSASQYREQLAHKSNNRQEERTKQQAFERPTPYFCPSSKSLKWKSNMVQNKGVEVKELPTMTVAYIRHIGPYKGEAQLFERLWNKLFAWGGPRGLIGTPNFKLIAVYHDDPNVTIEDKLRMSVCITVPTDTKVEGEVGKMAIENGTYAVARFELGKDEFTEAWNWVYGVWFPTSGYQPDDKPCFEIYPEEPQNGKFIVDICVPVKPM